MYRHLYILFMFCLMEIIKLVFENFNDNLLIANQQFSLSNSLVTVLHTVYILLPVPNCIIS